MNRPTRVFSRFQQIDVRANGDEVAKPMLAEMFKVLKIDTPQQAAKAFGAEGVAHKIGDPQDERLRRLRGVADVGDVARILLMLVGR